MDFASSDSGGAPQHVALSKTVQIFVDAIRNLGRMPTRNTGVSADEREKNKLAKRYANLKDSIPGTQQYRANSCGGHQRARPDVKAEQTSFRRRAGRK